jgi:hypothetical protein
MADEGVVSARSTRTKSGPADDSKLAYLRTRYGDGSMDVRIARTGVFRSEACEVGSRAQSGMALS